VPRRRTNPTQKPKTNLAKARLKAGFTQKDMAEWLGISLRHYRRLETGEDQEGRLSGPRQPPLSLLVNCALILRVPFDEVAPSNWHKTWTRYDLASPDGPPSKREMDKKRQRWDDIKH
jgi:transcriptional regulator with XRE-family HTH domain